MKRLCFVVACLAAGAAEAQMPGRYAPRPPIYLSPDLTEPWLMQIRPSYRESVMPAPRPVIHVPAPSPVAPNSDGTAERREPKQAAVDPRFLPQQVAYTGEAEAGTIIVDTNDRFLYLIEGNGKARRYGVGVGRPGFEWAGTHTITRKAEWPDWRPPAAMRQRQPHLPEFMAGGPNNPLGARALYLGDSEYRIHGTSEPWTIGQAVSSGCIRMRNEDVTDLYERVGVGTKVKVI